MPLWLFSASVSVAFAGISCRAACLAVKDLERLRVEFVLSHPFPSSLIKSSSYGAIALHVV